ncbi:MAG: N-6 DNA methylase [Candidatus Bathyarchaeota archaeon]|nr:N-6 DNA methylase [Candidatus Bathyarchaeota archaeon]MDH5595575.1 N-6 DNA methylase [Candidatus Bathyarchaeota archaeon]
MAERPTEQTYASDLKEWINQIIKEDALPFSQAKVEIMKDKKRADILLYDSANNCILIIEVKRPNELPSDPEVKKQAYDYAQGYKSHGLRSFATHNVNILILYDALTQQKVDQFSVTYVKDLDEYVRKKGQIIESFRRILRWFADFLKGEPAKPIDESIIEILHGYIQGIVAATSLGNKQIESYIKDVNYRKRFWAWLVDKGWEDPKSDRQKLEEYAIILAKQFLYIYINKILFYNVLKDKHPRELARLTLPRDTTAATFYAFVETYFAMAIKASQDYETVFETNFVDNIPVSDDAVSELVKLAEYLNTLDYADIGYDIIGRVFAKLIPQNERHTLGQYFTRSDVVDLILGFCLKDSDSNILDPACGSGTFLVRAYYRLRYLGGREDHAELLRQLWGVDISKFPAHLATINLAIRNLSSRENYPNIVYGDFFDIPGPKTNIRIGMQSSMTQWVGAETKSKVEVQGLDAKSFERIIPIMKCVVGNPPYTRQEEMGEEIFGEKYKQKLLKVIKSDFPMVDLPLRSSIYAYFFPHGARFLQDKSRLGFVCLRSWLDTGYGRKLQRFFLEHFKIIAVIESEQERWFPEAQMLPCIVILETCNDKKERDKNIAKFVRLKSSLSDFVPTIQDERDMVQEIYRLKKIDEFTCLIENAEETLSMKQLDFLDKEIHLYENDKLRIVTVKQTILEGDQKWGKFLSAPSVFFKILERCSGKTVRLDKVAQINLGIKTGANEFFCLPNRFYNVKAEKKSYALLDKSTRKQSFTIEKEFLKPVVIKIKPHREIGLDKPDGNILIVQNSIEELKRTKKQVLEYIKWGENKQIRLKRGKDKGKTIVGYQNIKSIQTRNPWYDLGVRKSPQLIFPSIFWARHVVFWNEIGAYPTNAFFEIHPSQKANSKILCAVLNSSFTALMTEFSGRYIENRDKTISNQIMVFEVQGLPVIDPCKIHKNERTSLENSIEKLMKRQIGFRALFDTKDIKDKEELDRIVFCNILGLSEDDMKETREQLAKIVQRRIERHLVSENQ